MQRTFLWFTHFIIGCFLVLALQAQEYRIKNYGVREGITHSFVYTINQDSRGYIWIGTGEGLCRFNGMEFNTDLIQDSLASEVAAISFKDSKGTLWFGYQSGDLARYNGLSFERIKSGMKVNSAITGFAELDKDNLLIGTLNNGVYAFHLPTGQASKISGTGESLCTSLFAQQSLLFLGTQDGLTLYTLNISAKKAEPAISIRELDFIKIQDIQPSTDGKAYWIATEDQGVFRLTVTGDQYTLVKTGSNFNLGSENAQAIFEDSEKQLWISTLRNGLFKLGTPDAKGGFATLAHYDKQHGLPGNSIKKVYEDLEGNIWVATYGDGLSLLSVQAFTFGNFENPGLENDVQSVVVTQNGVTYIGGREGLFAVKGSTDRKAVRVNGIPADRISALKIIGQNLLVGTGQNGLFVVNINNGASRRISYGGNSLGYSVNCIAGDLQTIYLGTNDGIYKFNGTFSELAHFTTGEGLPHNVIENILIDSQNRVLFAAKSHGIYQLPDKGDPVNLFPARDNEIEFKSITEDRMHGIWAATYGDGVFLFKNDSVYHFTVNFGLKADYCYSIISDKNNGIWVGHRLGISRINIDNLRISKYDMNIGIAGDCNLNAVCTDNSGILYFGTTEGLLTYDPVKDSKRKLPPFTNITKLLISDKVYDFNKEIVLPYKAYKLRIEFIGLNYSDPQAVRYQYRLEGYDLGWSDVTDQTFASYPRIEDGEYVFSLRTFNGEGLSQETPVIITLRVKLPIWKTWWFIALLVVLAMLSVYTFIRVRERKQRLLQEYLERELVLRTREVVEQKEEIEIKNRDITDSINYAKRIQTSMLPPVKRLQHHFSGCFVFYSPRDIVSGDFYWFDQVNDNKFIIVCADSTGHGVPGAFMSMIGSTLIKDICTRESGNSPSSILQVLDSELRNTLNQNLEDGSNPADGMDIIVCEIDLKTHYVRYASAMRPMIIYRNGEEVFIKGSRNSVGGHYDKEENIFENEGLQLSKGDIIYMFSDGYSDQFGGPMGKKFKMVRLKNLLLDIHQKPMDEQFVHVKSSFNLWKENYDQVDDVLFMGIKI